MTGVPEQILGWIKPDDGVRFGAGVADYEADLGRPVVTANQATLWKGLRLLGRPAQVPGAGALLGGAGVLPGVVGGRHAG